MDDETYLIIGIVIYIIASIVAIVYFVLKKIEKKEETSPKNTTQKSPSIYVRKRLRTSCEEEFYNKLQTIINGRKNRVLQSQIPLSSVVEKKYNNGFAGELYRTIDFGIFDDSGEVLVLIELNDASHFQQKRIYRDCRVKMILDDANIPLVTFWTNKPNDIDYITKVLWNYL